MASNIEQYIPLRDCIFMYSEAAKQDDTKFKRLWTMAFRGFSDMGLNNFWQPVTEILPVNENRTVTLPDDYLIWSKVGQISGNEITLMRSNQNMLSNARFRGAADIVNNQWWFNGFQHYGVTSYRKIIEFKIQGNAIYLDSNFEGEGILLEYLASPCDNEDFAIPFHFTEAMIDWLSWQDVKHLPATSHFNRGDKNDRSLAYRASLKRAKKKYRPLRLSEITGSYTEFNMGLEGDYALATVVPSPTNNAGGRIVGFREQIAVGEVGSVLLAGDTNYVLNYPYILEDTVEVDMPQSNIPTGQTNQFSYTITYTTSNATIYFTNDDGSGNNLGVQDGMLITIKGLRYI